MGDGYRVAWADGLAEIELACGKANALNPRSLAAIAAAFDEAEAGGARGVVLTGYERFFSAGLDLVTLFELERGAMAAFVREFDRVMLRVFGFPRPVVGALGGHAVAGGCILALACDARLVAEGPARIGLNEIRLGLPFPAGALEIARHALPAASVETVLYEGELYPPREALARGLVSEVVTGTPLEAARALCRRWADQPAAAFARIKASLKDPAVCRAREAGDALREAFVDAWFGPEGRRRIGEARARLGA